MPGLDSALPAAGALALLALAYAARHPLARALLPAQQLLRAVRLVVRDALDAASGWFGARGDLFWIGCLTALGLFIYLPYLDTYPLWDPWEPHYTQVAWEMEE